MVTVLLVAGACGSGDGDGTGDGAGGLRKLPLGAAGSSRSSATMSAEASADSSASMIAPLRAVEYKVAADPDDVPETATAYEVKARPADEVRAKVAKALDVDADRIEVGVGGYDWYYSGNVSPDTAVSSSPASSPACAPDEKCIVPEAAAPPTVKGVPSAAEAEERVRDLLESMGASLDGRFEAFGEDGYNRTIQFTPAVDGHPVAGLQTSVAFGADARIEYANGVLADVESIGEYPLVGLDEAVKRLQEGFGAGGGVRSMGAPEPAIDPAATSDAPASGGGSAGSTGSAGSGVTGEDVAPSEPPTDPPAPSDEPTMTIEPDPGIPSVPLEPEVVEFTGAELSLQLVAAGCPDDPVYLVPTFDLLPGPAASVIAVEDDVIAGQGSDPADQEFEPCPGQGQTEVPAGKPEPAPMPADVGREPAKP